MHVSKVFPAIHITIDSTTPSRYHQTYHHYYLQYFSFYCFMMFENGQFTAFKSKEYGSNNNIGVGLLS